MELALLGLLWCFQLCYSFKLLHLYKKYKCYTNSVAVKDSVEKAMNPFKARLGLLAEH